ncbi:MAG: TraU family protein [Desulfosalsimonadaceae bacterium]
MKLRYRKISKIILFLLVWMSYEPFAAHAICACKPHNPLTEVCWQCMFPFKIGGVTVSTSPTDAPDAPDLASSPVCVCPLPAPVFARVGIPVSFWEPARFIEVVKDAYCFPSIGAGLAPVKMGFQNGGSEDGGTTQEGAATFFQAHYAIYPIWTIMEAFTDFACLETSGFDIAYMTEVDPTWNDDLFAQIIYPETLLFANMPAQLSCIADSVSANAGLPLSPLYWCLGSEGSTYPMSGNMNDDNLVQASLAAASRLVYKMGRIGAICDVGLHYCTCIPTPIWVKHNYRFSLAKPVTGFQCVPPGRSSLIWGAGKNPPLPITGDSPDNFMYIVFRKRACCVF